jgi:hypothetical protein
MRTRTPVIRWLRTAVYAMLFFQGHACLAQELAFNYPPRPTVSRAADFISMPTALKVNSDLKFVRLDTPTAKKIAKARLQVRIFALRDGEKTPSPRGLIEDCYLYLTTVYPVNLSSSGEMTIARTDAAWLSLSSTRQSFSSGSYYLVIETEGADDRIFRLNKNDAADYFGQGFPLIVETDTDIPLQLVQEKHNHRQADAVTLSQRINDTGNSVPCYKYKSHKTVIVELEPDLASGELVACR